MTDTAKTADRREEYAYTLGIQAYPELPVGTKTRTWRPGHGVC